MRRALRRLARRLLRWGGWALDALYPRDCFFCGRPSGDSQICLECYERLTLTRHPSCLVCGAESALPEGPDFVCSDCLRRRPAFTRAFIAARYDGDVRALIHAFKYHGGLWLTDDLVRILIAHYLAHIAPLRLGIDAVVPVPMLRRKRLRRGYNQSEELARLLARQLHLPYLPRLLRRVHTGVLSQTRLARAERLANAKPPAPPATPAPTPSFPPAPNASTSSPSPAPSSSEALAYLNEQNAPRSDGRGAVHPFNDNRHLRLVCGGMPQSARLARSSASRSQVRERSRSASKASSS